MAGVLTGIPAGASASACRNRTGTEPPSPGSSDNNLRSVAVLSACNAWAVGSYFTNGTTEALIEHWNGRAWTQVPSPEPSSSDNELVSVAAVSATNIWAVGTYTIAPNAGLTLALHWNGTAWKDVATPDPAGAAANNSLASVAVRSARNAWAVGSYNKGSTTQTLALHWTGTVWKDVASPSPNSFGNDLSSVTVISPHNVWAVGAVGGGAQTLAERWNGTSWKRVPSPDPGGSANVNVFSAVGASSSANIWAVGFYDTGSDGTGFQHTLALHCC